MDLVDSRKIIDLVARKGHELLHQDNGQKPENAPTPPAPIIAL